MCTVYLLTSIGEPQIQLLVQHMCAVQHCPLTVIYTLAWQSYDRPRGAIAVHRWVLQGSCRFCLVRLWTAHPEIDRVPRPLSTASLAAQLAAEVHRNQRSTTRAGPRRWSILHAGPVENLTRGEGTLHVLRCSWGSLNGYHPHTFSSGMRVT
jgi:hypothetical protein